MNFPTFLALILLSIGTPAFSQSPPTLLVFGDSISAAYGMRAEEGWVTLLREKLQREGYGWRVVNASVSGETTAGGRARLPRALELHQPRIMVLELGANDGLRGLPLQEVHDNLEAMIRAARAADVELVLLGMPLPTNYGPKYTRRFQSIFENLAAAHQLAFVPFLLEDAALEPQLMQDDGLHPNARAQPRLLEMIWPALLKVIQTYR